MDLKQACCYLLVVSLPLLTAADPAVLGEDAPKNLFGDFEPESVPFEEGECLQYEVKWKPIFFLPSFKVGELSLSIRESDYQERPAFTISASVISDGVLSSMAGLTIKDYFESIIDRHDFRSYRIFRQIRQNKRRRDLEVFFDYEQHQTHVREINLQSDPPEEVRNEKTPGIPGPVADVVSVFYVARLRTLHPGEEYFIHFSEKGRIDQIRVEVQKKQKVKTDIGSFDSVKIQTVSDLFKGGGRFRIWYSTDSLRLPVKFEASVRFGKVSGKITRLETPQASRDAIQEE